MLLKYLNNITLCLCFYSTLSYALPNVSDKNELDLPQMDEFLYFNIENELDAPILPQMNEFLDFNIENELDAPILPPIEEFLLDVYINKNKIAEALYILHDNHERLYVSEAAIKNWKIKLPNCLPLRYQDTNYFPLDAYPELQYELNINELRLSITAPPAMFQEHIVDFNTTLTKVLRPQSDGAYINYDFTTHHYENSGETVTSGITEFAYFNHNGIGISDFLLQNTPNQNHAVRLNTTWTLDKPENMATWRYGDSITSTNAWSGAVRFGGIQYATNFATQPNFVTFPLPSFKGEAVVPTSVQFFLNNQSEANQNVDSGPFQIQGVPAITGAGDLVVKTHDILGRESVAVIPYYGSQDLLKPGLVDFSYEAGFIRNNFGISSNDYGRFAAVGSYQKGITDKLTDGWHAELLKNQQTIGISSTYLVNNYFTLTSGGAVSHSNKGNGGLLIMGAERQTPAYSLGMQSTVTSVDYMQLGVPNDQPWPSMTNQLFGGINSKNSGTFGVTYTSQNIRNNGSCGMATFSYNANVTDNLFFLLNLVKRVKGNIDNQLFASLVWSPAPSYTASMSTNQQNKQSQGLLGFSKALPPGPGYGYNLFTSQGSPEQQEADFFAQNDHGTYAIKTSRLYGQNNYEIDASGGVVRFAGDTFFTRLVEQSFTVVQIPDFENVGVYDSNLLIGKTNKHGNLFIPNTLPYQKNDIRIELNDLPIDTEIDTEQLESYPYYRSGTLVQFPVRRIRSFTFKIVTSEHDPIPPGVMLQFENAAVPVGYNGEVYFTNSSEKNYFQGLAAWDENQCQIELHLPQDSQPELDLGTIICKDFHDAKNN